MQYSIFVIIVTTTGNGLSLKSTFQCVAEKGAGTDAELVAALRSLREEVVSPDEQIYCRPVFVPMDIRRNFGTLTLSRIVTCLPRVSAVCVVLLATPLAQGQLKAELEAQDEALKTLGSQAESVEKAPLVPPKKGENAQSALAQIQENVNHIETLQAEIEMSEIREVKPPKKDKKATAKPKNQGAAKAQDKAKPKYKRVAKSGPMVISRGQGARVALTRKDETKEYIANASTLWVYEHKEKEAKYIPTSLPFISGFVQSAFKMDVLAAMDSDTMKLRGSQEFDGEPCWVIEGKSPGKLSLAGVSPTKLIFWVSKNDGIPRKISVPSEDKLQIVLRGVTPGSPVDSSQFTWQPPSGVKSKNIFGF